MIESKEKHKSIIVGYYYACCPYCKTTLIQCKNGTDAIVKCPLCSEYIHIIVRDDTILTKRKGI